MVMRKYGVRVEGNLATLCVGSAVLEGIGHQLDPELNLVAEALPYLAHAPRLF